MTWLNHLLWTLAVLVSSTVAAPRTKYNFNSDWKLHVGDVEGAEKPDFNDEGWDDIVLPRAWNEDEAFKLDIANLSTGISWYRKHFKVPSSGSKVFLEFEGIRHGGEFYLNGEWIGRSENGVMAFGFDVTDYVVEEGENILAAQIDSSWDYAEKSTGQKYQWSDRNFYANYGGINKNVFLHITDRLYQTLPLYSNLNTTGVYVYARDIEVDGRIATITAESQIRNEYEETKHFEYLVDIIDLDNNTVGTLKGGTYEVEAGDVIVASASGSLSNLELWSWGYGYLYTVKTSLVVDGELVDQVKIVTGFRKTSFGDGMFRLNDRALQLKGYAQRTTNEWVALGSAVPAWLSDFSNGMVLGSNGNLIRWMHVTPWKQDVESLDRLGILQAMPAGDSESDATGRRWEQRVELMRDAIIYNRNNPSIVFYEAGNKGVTEEHMQEMKDLRDKYDPYGGRAAGCREMMGSSVAEFGGEMLYINKGSDIPFWQMEYNRDESLRKYWDEFSPPYHPDGEGNGEAAWRYNRNGDSFAAEDTIRWYDYYEMRPGTGKRVNAGGVNIIFSDSNTHHRGAENYRRSGEVDAVRLPKDAWYAHKVIWDNWVDIEKAAVHIVGHWNYNESTVKDVYVISTADEVELVLNGESLGRGEQSYQFLFKFANITFQPGELEAIGYFEGSDKPTASDKRVTTGEPAAIRLTAHTSPTGFHASGADIALLDVEVVDDEGNRVPTALNIVDFELLGEATWRGGIAQGPDNYILSTSLPVENGVNRVLLRSTTTAGKVELVARSEGLASASITLDTKEFKSADGLSLELPGDSLPSYLSRGPTPQGESYTMKRRPISITSVTAGSNEESASYSFNDNESETWESSSTTEDAWIRYELDGATDINTIVVKLRRFQNTQYNIRVSVENKVVWEGRTPTSLGYLTFEFDTARGRAVTVASTNGLFGINEIEFYGPL
ncbi:hypothetical protein DL769_010874 [Monosporascus sp. CRB-8-3]|nr:hypothetical protein DL769_010874 [Monosporascus sp. CRB-8-3]